MTMCSITKWPRRRLVLSLLCLATIGCGQSGRDFPLDQPGARDACKVALTAWKEGKKPADIKPKIIVGDDDWETGKKLVAFEIQPDDKSDGSNLHISVELTLQDAAGKESKSNVLYIVSTSPAITVFRR